MSRAYSTYQAKSNHVSRRIIRAFSGPDTRPDTQARYAALVRSSGLAYSTLYYEQEQRCPIVQGATKPWDRQKTSHPRNAW
jgi:hypothetical protein